MPQKKLKAKYLCDLYGAIHALSTRNNVERSAFIDGLNSGEILVMRSVAKELKDFDEDLYKDFQSVKSGQVYQATTSKHYALQQLLMERYGTNIWGNSPRAEHFEAIAICVEEGLDMLTHDKAMLECKNIVKKCKLPNVRVIGLANL